MRPLKPEERAAAVQAVRSGGEELLAEYERLLAQRFSCDPDISEDAVAALSGGSENAIVRERETDARESRILELRKLLFPQIGNAKPAEEAEKEQPIRDPVLESTISAGTKEYGDGSIMHVERAPKLQREEALPTGSLALDLALGVGGVPRGRVVEIFGPESSGKTTLLLHIIANAQQAGGLAAFIDAEHKLDPGYATKLGVNLDDLLVSQPESGEEALKICETLARSNALDVIVVDSVAAFINKPHLGDETGMATMGMQGRLMARALRELVAILNRSKTTCVFTNQLREHVGVMFGNPAAAPGSKALKFYASVRIDIRRKDTVKDAVGKAIGNRVKVKVVKNKVAPPFAETEFDIIYNHGINKEGNIIDVGINTGVIEKVGASLIYNGQRIGDNLATAHSILTQQAELVRRIRADIEKRVTADIKADSLPVWNKITR
jgi:recombination protein RecA